MPWVYAEGEKPALIIVTLEALAVLVSLRAFLWKRSTRRTNPGNSGTYLDRQQSPLRPEEHQVGNLQLGRTS